ncbi:unnamed protein product [Chrysodeixis includens]|uniref:Uncharacterized protein n=1 Tax=Chrysodeixis includens TaxID=689277 RepID=A0A9N8L389_CHRIL|nr:unnamed protein product [Chrysodeixis includens]
MFFIFLVMENVASLFYVFMAQIEQLNVSHLLVYIHTTRIAYDRIRFLCFYMIYCKLLPFICESSLKCTLFTSGKDHICLAPQISLNKFILYKNISMNFRGKFQTKHGNTAGV